MNLNNIRRQICQMTKSQSYRESKRLSAELGLPLGGTWSQAGSTASFWRNRASRLNRNFNNRANNHRRAVELSQNLNVPDQLTGTSNATWIRELKRLRESARRAIQIGRRRTRESSAPILTQIQQAQTRSRVSPLLAEIQNSRDLLQRKKEQRRQRREAAEQARRAEEERTKRMYDRLINDNQFQTVLTRVIDTGKTLTDRQANEFYNRLRSRGRYTLKITTDGDDNIVAVGERTKDFIIKILKDGAIVSDEEQWGSDILDRLRIDEITRLTVSRLQTPQRVIRNRDGNFFPYIIGKGATGLNLQRYQIYNQEEAYDDKIVSKREQCLIHTLKTAGIGEAIINQIKLAYVAGCSIRKKDLKNISNIIQRKITIHSMNGKRIAKATYRPKKEYGEEVNVAIHSAHYFLFEQTKYTKFSIDNYEELKDVEEFHNVVKIRSRGKANKKTYSKIDDSCKDRRINSLLLVDKLHKAEVFKKLDFVKFEESGSHQEIRDHIYLDNIANEQRVCGRATNKSFKKKSDDTPRGIYYADYESFVKDDRSDEEKKKNPINHELYLLGVVNSIDDNVNILNVCDPVFNEPNHKVSAPQLLVYEFLNILTKGGTQNGLCYFHNLKYDYHLMEQYTKITKRCVKDNQIYSVNISYKGKEVELRDSFKLLPFALSKFQKNFGLPAEFGKKEALAYEYYTKENNDKRIKTSEYEKLLSKEDRLTFLKGLPNEPSYNEEDKTFNPLTYYKEYLRLDCLVLKKGLEKFESLIDEITDGQMSIYECLTISSLTDQYMKNEGAYENVYEMQGNLRAYVAKAVYGGRVCCNKKYQKKLIEGKIADYDGVSLYPSAINRLCRESGLPKGPAKRYDPKEKENKMKKKIEHMKNSVSNARNNRNIARKRVAEEEEKLNQPPIWKGNYYCKKFLWFKKSEKGFHKYLTYNPFTRLYGFRSETAEDIREYIASKPADWLEKHKDYYESRLKDEEEELSNCRRHLTEEKNRLEELEKEFEATIIEDKKDWWKTKDYSILTVKITKVNKKQQMPFIAHKSDSSILYTNEPPKEPIVIDSTLEDYINFHEIEYEVLEGVYWDEGFNKKMGGIVQRLFTERLKYKKTNKALANTIKLMLNSTYGKTITSKVKTQKIIVSADKDNDETKFNNYIYSNFNTIKTYRKLNEHNYEVERIKADNSYNRGHIGCAILSMSKRIMNELFDVANDGEVLPNGERKPYPIYYTDTDSLHCNLEDVPKLEKDYQKKYNKELSGKNLEQFHVDFDLEGAESEIHAVKSIFLGKKSYLDCLESKDKDGNIITGYHIRLKGITKEGLEHVSKEYDESYLGLYKYLTTGAEKEITLNPFNPDENKNKVLFEFKNGRVKTRTKFTRKVKF